jgi:hypothetical protein
MTAYPFLGTSGRQYPQYVVADGGGPLKAEPGESYDMVPVPGYEDEDGNSLLPVPPADGLWGTRAAPASRPAAKAADKGSDDGKAA